ncbi:hypothetical protein [Absidia glauca]|uniref:Uncharacterized protein n=1 Tax=Absidia glauca TaxID=4829 RepID=A0A168KUU7_ABSGL|nr:hypothetical protein [Absidia glauca]
MHSLFLTILLATVSFALLVTAQLPKIEATYTDGSRVSEGLLYYGECIPIRTPFGQWLDHINLPLKSQCEYFYDEECQVPSKPPHIIEPGIHKIENVDQYGRCSALST